MLPNKVLQYWLENFAKVWDLIHANINIIYIIVPNQVQSGGGQHNVTAASIFSIQPAYLYGKCYVIPLEAGALWL